VPTRYLADAELARFNRLPEQVSPEELGRFFTLSPDDLAFVGRHRGEENRLGVALQLGALRWVGFAPDDLRTAPQAVVAYVASQVQTPPAALSNYGQREQTRTDHFREVQAHLGFRLARSEDLDELAEWLVERALEHDRPTLLLELACQRLRSRRVVRPGIDQPLMRLVASTRERAQSETYWRFAPLLTPIRMAMLDELLVPEPELDWSRLAWLRQGAVAPTPRAILGELEKLTFLRSLGVPAWDLGRLPPNRRKFLAQLGRRSSNQALQRMPPERRYPILLAFLEDTTVELVDEVVDLFDRAIAAAFGRARRELEEFRQRTARATNEKVVLFTELVHLLLDPSISDDQLRSAIYSRLPEDRLRAAAEESERLMRPEDDNHFDLLAQRYAHLREFMPAVITALDVKAHHDRSRLLEALELLRELNRERRRRLPVNAPVDFVPGAWRPYVVSADGTLDRRYWELCLVAELRNSLRSGDVWLAGSRRYADPATYLIPPEDWEQLRPAISAELDQPILGYERLQALEHDFHARLRLFQDSLPLDDSVRLVEDRVVVRPLTAEILPDDRMVQMISDRLPRVDVPDLLIEVDAWTGFSQQFFHAGESRSRSRDLLRHLYASVLAQACNLGLTAMAEVAELPYDQLRWATNWYLREETLKAANAAIVNYQHGLPLAQAWGGGTLSSSDGQRFPVRGKAANATALPYYFGLGKGITFYTHTSDQHSQYGTKVVPATIRDATYVLDEILDNETELPILEHTTDTTGYTELVFALFDLLGLQFAPRIRDLGDQRLYRIGRVDGPAGRLLSGTINRARILDHWDDLLRVAGSLKRGWVTASLLISRLQASPRQNLLTRALQEYGRVIKTLFVLRYLESEDYRRRINRQLNKGEALHALRRFLFFAHAGQVRRRQHEEQTNQALCLNLLTNAVVAWNTVYLQAALDDLEPEGHFGDVDRGHLSPAIYGHVNPYGRYRFDVDLARQTGLRPLRRPAAVP
jgi:TnpA family transposase